MPAEFSGLENFLSLEYLQGDVYKPCIFLERKIPALILWICFDLRVIFNKFLEDFRWFFEKIESDDFSEFGYFELGLKNYICIISNFDFLDILFEIKWEVFP